MQAIKFIIFISLSVLVYSCQKEIKYKGSEKDLVLVVNAVVENDSAFRVYLERSVFFLEDNVSAANKLITSGATIKVTNTVTGQVYVMTTPTSLNMYEFPFTTEADTDYEIEVQHPDYPTCTAKTRTSNKIELLSVDTSSVPLVENQVQQKRAVLTWNDPGGENYYIIRARVDYPGQTGEGMPSSYAWMSSKDISVDNVTNNLDGSFLSSDYLAISDPSFNGQQKQLTIEFPDPGYYYTDTLTAAPVTITYQLIATTKETYLYYLSVRKQGNSNVFSEPVKVFTNIKNGYGIFGTFNYSEIVL